MQVDPKKLKEKGWHDYEVNHVLETLEKAEMKKSPLMKKLEDRIHWAFLLVAILGNLAFSLELVPILIFTPTAFAYSMTMLLGLVFGALFASQLFDGEWMEMKHHLVYSVIIPLAGFVNFAVIVQQANIAGRSFNPLLLGACYLGAFFVPYVLTVKGVSLWTSRSGA